LARQGTYLIQQLSELLFLRHKFMQISVLPIIR
jgi:hypothetical protein